MRKHKFSWQKRLCQFVNNPIIYHGTKNLQKVATHSLSKCRTADGLTENSDFIGPSVGQGSKKSNLEQGATLYERENNRKLNPFIKTLVHRSNIHYSETNKKETEKSI